MTFGMWVGVRKQNYYLNWAFLNHVSPMNVCVHSGCNKGALQTFGQPDSDGNLYILPWHKATQELFKV